MFANYVFIIFLKNYIVLHNCSAIPRANDTTPGAKALASRGVFLAEFAAAVAQANSIHPCCVVFVVSFFV